MGAVIFLLLPGDPCPMKFLIALLLLASSASVFAQSKCEASIHGFKIRNVYVMGGQYNGVAWAYKHLAEETCLTPVTDVSKADAILDISPISSGSSARAGDVSVVCTSGSGSSRCSDSEGNLMDIECRGGVCSSYYGPDPATLITNSFDAWIATRWYESYANLYTLDHKLLWRSVDQKGDWAGAGWPDEVRLGTNSPVCKVGAWERPKYKNYRHWASTKCGVEFDPLVSIDIKLEDKKADHDQMERNAEDAAKK